jgi:hypothetical protein
VDNAVAGLDVRGCNGRTVNHYAAVLRLYGYGLTLDRLRAGHINHVRRHNLAGNDRVLETGQCHWGETARFG